MHNKMSVKKGHSPKKLTTYPTIAAAVKAYGLTTLAKAVSLTPLLSAVTNGTTAVTVFAPTDEVSGKQAIDDISLPTFH